jgi:hypothetical protein
MPLNWFSVVTAVVVLALLSGCRTGPIRNVESARIAMVGGQAPSLEDVERAIYRGCAVVEPPWHMKKVAPGHIVATINYRSDMAEVDIYFDTRKYSIRYRASSNLYYDGKQIHNNYNAWIQDLDNAIKAELAKPSV